MSYRGELSICSDCWSSGGDGDSSRSEDGASESFKRSTSCLSSVSWISERSGNLSDSSSSTSIVRESGDGPGYREREEAGMDREVEVDCLSYRADDIRDAAEAFGFEITDDSRKHEILAKKNDTTIIIASQIHQKAAAFLKLINEEHHNVEKVTHFFHMPRQIDLYIREVPVMSLQKYMNELHPSMVSECFARTMAQQLCEGLLFFERKGLIHQNLKLSTVLIFGRPFILKLGGFEKVTSIAEASESDIFWKNGAERSEDLHFIPPELARRVSLQEGVILNKIDPYRLGVLVYRIMMGRFHLDSLNPGIHMSEKIWENDFIATSIAFQKTIRNAMLFSPKTRFSLAQIKYSPWMTEKAQHQKVLFPGDS